MAQGRPAYQPTAEEWANWRKKALLRRFFEKIPGQPEIPWSEFIDPVLMMFSGFPETALGKAMVGRTPLTKLVRRYPQKIETIEDLKPIIQDLATRLRIKKYLPILEKPSWEFGTGSYGAKSGIKIKLKPSWPTLPESFLKQTKSLGPAAKTGMYYTPKWHRFPQGFVKTTSLHELLHPKVEIIEKVLPYKTRLGRKVQEALVEALTQRLKGWAFLKRVPR